MHPKYGDTLAHMRRQVAKLISERYGTMEAFCWEKGLSKATVSNFMGGKKDFQLSTLEKLARALNLKLKIRLV